MKLRGSIKFSNDPHDPSYWPVGMAAIDKINLLSLVGNPGIFQAVHVLVDEALRNAWRNLTYPEIERALGGEDIVSPDYHWKCDAPSVTKKKGRAK